MSKFQQNKISQLLLFSFTASIAACNSGSNSIHSYDANTTLQNYSTKMYHGNGNEEKFRKEVYNLMKIPYSKYPRHYHPLSIFQDTYNLKDNYSKEAKKILDLAKKFQIPIKSKYSEDQEWDSIMFHDFLQELFSELDTFEVQNMYPYMLYFQDEDIHKIYVPTTTKVYDSKNGGDIKVTLFNEKHLIMQQFELGAPSAAIQMLILDNGGNLDMELLTEKNILNEVDSIQNIIKEAGFTTIVTDKKIPLATLSQKIKENGSGIIFINDHVVVLDNVDVKNNILTIRDSYHGWKIDVKVEDTFKTKLIQIDHLSPYLIKNFAVDDPNARRLFTKINDTAYYKSSGVNSGYPQTVFPFDQFIGLNIFKPGSFVIGEPDKFYNFILENFVNQIVNENIQEKFKSGLINLANQDSQCKEIEDIHEKIACFARSNYSFKNIFSRFYSLNDTIISYEFGTGFWQDDISFNIQDELQIKLLLEELMNDIGVRKGALIFYKDPEEIYDTKNDIEKDFNTILDKDVFANRVDLYK